MDGVTISTGDKKLMMITPSTNASKRKENQERAAVASVVRLDPSYADAVHELRCRQICHATHPERPDYKENYHVLTPFYTIHDADYWFLTERLKFETREDKSSRADVDYWCLMSVISMAKEKAKKMKRSSDTVVPTGPPYFDRRCDLFDENSALSLISIFTSAKRWVNPFAAIGGYHGLGVHGNARDDLFCCCETPAWAFSLCEKQLLSVCSNGALVSALADQMRSALGESVFMPYLNLAFLAYFDQSNVDNPKKQKQLLDEEGNIFDDTYIIDFKKMAEYDEKQPRKVTEEQGEGEHGDDDDDDDPGDFKKLAKLSHMKRLTFNVAIMSLNSTVLANLMEASRMLKDHVAKGEEEEEEEGEDEKHVKECESKENEKEPTEPFQTHNPALIKLGIRFPEDVADQFTDMFMFGLLLAFRREVEIAHAKLTEKTRDIILTHVPLHPHPLDSVRKDGERLAKAALDIMLKSKKNQGTTDSIAFFKDGLTRVFDFLIYNCANLKDDDNDNDNDTADKEELDEAFVERKLSELTDKLNASFDSEKVSKIVSDIAEARADYEKNYLECFADVATIVNFIVFLSQKQPAALAKFISGYADSYYTDIMKRLCASDSDGSPVLTGLESHGDVKLCVAMGLYPKLYHPPLKEFKHILNDAFPEILRHGFEKKTKTTATATATTTTTATATTETSTEGTTDGATRENDVFIKPYTDIITNMMPWDNFYEDDEYIAAKGRIPGLTDVTKKATSSQISDSKRNAKERATFLFSKYQVNNCFTNLHFADTKSENEGERSAYRCEYGSADYIFFSSALHQIAYFTMNSKDPKAVATLNDRIRAVFEHLFEKHRDEYHAFAKRSNHCEPSLAGWSEYAYGSFCRARGIDRNQEGRDDDAAYKAFKSNPYAKLTVTMLDIAYFEEYWLDAMRRHQHEHDPQGWIDFKKDATLPQDKLLRIMIHYVNAPIRSDLREQTAAMCGTVVDKNQDLCVPYLGNYFYEYLKNQSWLGVLFYDMLALEHGDRRELSERKFGSFDPRTAWALFCASQRCVSESLLGSPLEKEGSTEFDVYEFLREFGEFIRDVDLCKTTGAEEKEEEQQQQSQPITDTIMLKNSTP